MRILIINVSMDGSVGRIVSDLYHGYKMAGHECKVAIGRGPNGLIKDEDVIRTTTELDVYVHVILSRILGKTATYSRKHTRLFIDKVKKYSPDVVHIHGVYGYYINMKLLYNYLADNNIKVISTLHSCWDFTGHCCYFDYVDCRKWMTGCCNCLQKKAYPSSYIFENVEHNYKLKKQLYDSLNKCYIVTPSNWLSNLAKESFLSKHSISTIHNGVDLERFSPNREKYFADISKPIILCVANIWERRKGWDDVKELSRIIDESVQLVVLGVTDDQKKELDSKVISINRTSNVQEMVRLYSQATVLFNPTYEDNYPTVNLEALACHTPVVTYKTGGSPEVLEICNCGIVIKKRDYEHLIKYTKSVFNGEINLDFSNRNNLSCSCMVKEYIDLISRI